MVMILASTDARRREWIIRGRAERRLLAIALGGLI
jgi:hypothetical protein